MKYFLISASLLLFLSLACKKSKNNSNPDPGTCSDGIQNNGETDIDCGGICGPCTASWKPVSSGTTLNLKSVFFINNSTGWVVGGSGTIIKTIDGGKSWSAQQSPFNGTLNRVQFIDTKTGWIAGNQGILKTTDGGTTWTSKYTSATAVFSIYFIDENFGWAVLINDPGKVLSTIDGGQTWNVQNVTIPGLPVSWNDIFFLDKNFGWAVGTSSTGENAMKTSDGGNSWIAMPTHFTCPIYSVHFTSVQAGWCAGYYLFKSSANGSEFIKDRYFTEELRSVFFIDDNTGWVVGENGFIIKTIDAGINWTEVMGVSTAKLNSVRFTDSEQGWIAGDGGVLLHYSK